MRKFIIEELLDGKIWDNYTAEMIEADTLEDAIDIYKKQLLESGDFSQDEVATMQYRAYAQTQYILRKDDADKTYVRMSTDKEEIFRDLYDLGGGYCVEEVVLDLGGEPMTESEWYFCDEKVTDDDDESHEIKDGQEAYEEFERDGKRYAIAPAVCFNKSGIYVHSFSDGKDYFVDGIRFLPKDPKVASFLVDHLDRMSEDVPMENVILTSSGKQPSLLGQ